MPRDRLWAPIWRTPGEMSMTARAILIAALLTAPVAALAAPPSADSLLGDMLDAAGGRKAFQELGVLEIALTEEETAADGSQRNRQSTAYIDARTFDNLRLDLPGEIVVARNGSTAWATRSGAIDDRPQTEKMALATLNQRLFPLLLPFSLTMNGVHLGEVRETTFEGEPAWLMAVTFSDDFFVTPSMATTWYVQVRKSDGSLLTAEFFPPPGVRNVRSEGIRYRVLKRTTIGAGSQLPVQVLLDGIDVNGAPTGHVRVTKLQIRVRGPFDPSLFMHPVQLEAIEEGMD